VREYAGSRDLPVEMDMSGSYLAMEGLKQDNIDVALLAIPLDQEVPADSFRSVVLAHKVVTVAVPPSNPLTQISLSQLAAVYGDAEASNITRWGQLGLTAEWSSRSIAIVSVPPTTHSLTVDLFRHTVMQGPSFKRSLTYVDNVDRLRQRFTQDNSAIGLLPTIPSNQQGMKLLALSSGEGGLAHQPTADSVSNELYPLRLPVYLSFPLLRGAEVRDILRFLVTDEAAQAIAESGLIPLTRAQRERLALDFERL